MKVIVNGKAYKIKNIKHKKLLWFLREDLKLYGTKYGCGKALCGFCTVLINGVAIRSCQINVEEVKGKKITTIEGIPDNHPIKRAWIEIDVPQCGYCQSGQIMQAMELIVNNPNPSKEDILNVMYGNLCRCGTYTRIIKAIQLASKYLKEKR